jgi:hypothetical protein
MMARTAMAEREQPAEPSSGGDEPTGWGAVPR